MSNDKTFLNEMEHQFGTEEAIGVWFELDQSTEGVANILSVAEYDALYARLGDNTPSAISYLPNGGSAICCTDYAVLIYQRLPGRVKIFGFLNKDNPTAGFVSKGLHPGGHDFAIVDERYIVDPWPRLVPQAVQQMVYDLHDSNDNALVLDLYGPRDCWTRNEVAENMA